VFCIISSHSIANVFLGVDQAYHYEPSYKRLPCVHLSPFPIKLVELFQSSPLWYHGKSRQRQQQRFLLRGSGFLKPKATSANSRNLLLLGAPPGRFSHARSPVGSLRLWRGAIHRPSEGSAFLLRRLDCFAIIQQRRVFDPLTSSSRNRSCQVRQ